MKSVRAYLPVKKTLQSDPRFGHSLTYEQLAFVALAFLSPMLPFHEKTICIYQKNKTRLLAQIAHVNDEATQPFAASWKALRKAGRYSTIVGYIWYLLSIIWRHETNSRSRAIFQKVNNWILRIYLLSLVHCSQGISLWICKSIMMKLEFNWKKHSIFSGYFVLHL